MGLPGDRRRGLRRRAARRGSVGCLLGSLALIVTWLAFWDEILSDGLADAGTLRGLLVLAALLLLVLAALIAIRGGAPDGATSDVVTGAGVAAVGAGLISLGALPGEFFFAFGAAAPGVDTNMFWDTYLLVVSLGLAAFAAGGAGRRGSAYVGGIGLAGFIIVVGLDSGDASPEGSLLGWPLVALAAGLLAVAWAFVPRLGGGRA